MQDVRDSRTDKREIYISVIELFWLHNIQYPVLLSHQCNSIITYHLVNLNGRTEGTRTDSISQNFGLSTDCNAFKVYALKC